ncbi:TIGR01212 family radical SAM protein [Desulfonatronospira sp.]|uniref:TIGR01212 family radical SAM protein n=1 Tax=Desulfonatronospira sp. TaxID=1962951 RepID=UPI0025C43A64|nr:TIGR01212 family radical SAM protein [Desulfonatronospira sp.]
MDTYHQLSSHWKKKFGTRVQKIPLDAGFHCPNRDGTLSRKGCVFCNPAGSGTGLYSSGMSLKEQYHYWRTKFLSRQPSSLFAAYLQSYSNSYGPASRINNILRELDSLPDLRVLCIGTRPDCLDLQKISIMARFPTKETWLEMGLQSSNTETLKRINRGHTAEDFDHACRLAHSQGLKVCAHVIAGLPGEELEDFLQTIEFVNRLPVQGIKLHNMYVCKNTTLARWWYEGEYIPLLREEYVQWATAALSSLRADIVVHRLTGDPTGDELLAPEWSRSKTTTINMIRENMQSRGLKQGSSYQPDPVGFFARPLSTFNTWQE